MSDHTPPILEVTGVSKRFSTRLRSSLRYGAIDTLRDLCGRPPREGLGQDEFWAVKDVSFQLRRGESIGLLGANGAGKSTLLKIIAGLLKPDQGEVRIRGRVGALIELGAGMHPLLSGRENIRINAAILGLTQRELATKQDEIIAFADIGEFIDAPVQSYSSGMRVRLGFAVAAHLDPELLIIDEVLAVGDASFRAKCYERIGVLKQRCAIVMVSHSNSMQSRVSKRGLVLKRGQVIASGGIIECLDMLDRTLGALPINNIRTGTQTITLRDIRLNLTPPSYNFSQTILLCLVIENHHKENTEVCIDIVFRKNQHDPAAECNNLINEHPLILPSGISTLTIEINKPTLNAGTYALSSFITSPDMLLHYDWFENCGEIMIQGRTGTTHQQLVATWSLS